jgi:acyl-coenzyme A synthetase/AMP-(fatty) acid ligase
MPDEAAGEVPKAYIVKSKDAVVLADDQQAKRDIMRYVEENKARYKWVKAVEFIDVIPKSVSGKILRRMLRDMDREARKKDRLQTKL